MFDATAQVMTSPEFVNERGGSQLYVSRYGEMLLDTAVGARNQAEPMTRRTGVLWLCCAKPLVLLALVQVLEDSGLNEQIPVADVIPEFAEAGKAGVTIAQLLTHTVPYRGLGIQLVDGKPYDTDESPLIADWDKALAIIWREPLLGPPGDRVVYTALANWMVLAELIHRLTEEPYEEVVQRRVVEPLGMCDTHLRLDPANLPELAESWLLETNGELRRSAIDQPTLSGGRLPGLGTRGPAHDMARPLECIAGWRGAALISPELRGRIVATHRSGLPDPIFQGVDIRWGLGCCVDPLPFGLPPATRIAGHTGANSSLIFAELDSGVTISFVSSALMRGNEDWARKRRLVRAVYRDLGISTILTGR